MKRRRRLKKSVVKGIYITAGVGAVALICVLAGIFVKPKKEENARTTTSPYLSEEEAGDILANAPSTGLNMNNFRIPQGEQIIITIDTLVNEGNLVYSSSDENVVIVDNDGTLTAVAPGTAAITVTNGIKTDAIVVEVVEYETEKGENSFPLYSEANKNEGGFESESKAPVVGPTEGDDLPVKPTESVSVTPTQKPTQSTSVKPTQKPTQSTSVKPTQKPTQSTSVKPTQKPTESTTIAPTQSTGTVPTVAPTKKPDVVVYNSSDLYGRLESLGFVKRVANAFVFNNEKGVYCGQIILGSNYVQIYLKNDDESYKQVLLEVLKLIAPSKSEAVLNTFIEAKSDKAMVSDNKKVQIVVGKSKEHRQLIVYN